MEQRLIDRMEGAAYLFDEPEEALKAALITSLDSAVKLNICRLISEEFLYDKKDKIEKFLSSLINNTQELPIEIILISSWRTILKVISINKITHEMKSSVQSNNSNLGLTSLTTENKISMKRSQFLIK